MLARGCLFALAMLLLSQNAVALPPAASALLPSGWSFLNDPSPLLSSQERGSASVGRTDFSARPVMQANEGVVPSATGLWLPLGEMTPVAAFQNGRRLLIVAAGRHVIDTAGLTNVAPFEGVSARIMADMTAISILCPEGSSPLIRPVGHGWTVSFGRQSTPFPDVMLLGQDEGALTFTPPREDGALFVITFRDPDSGRRLLLGLSRSGSVSGDLIRRGAGFEVRPSLMGLVIAADADAIELRQNGKQFFLDRVGPSDTPLLAGGKVAAYGASDAGVALAGSPPEDLRESVRRARIAAAMASAGQRFDARIRLAQAAARLANGALVAQVLQVALEDQPEGSTRKDVRRLRQVSAVLNGRADPSLLSEEEGATPEDQFWRGMVRAQLPITGEGLDIDVQRTRTARLIAAGLPSVSGYSQPLRHRLLPVAAEWVARYGTAKDRGVLLSLPSVPETVLARALTAGETHALDARGKLETLAHNPSPMVWPVASEAALRFDLEKDASSAKAIGERVDGLMPAFRMVGREREARLLSIDAFIKGKEWRAAQQGVQDGQAVYGKAGFPGHDRLLVIARGFAEQKDIEAKSALAEVELLKAAMTIEPNDPTLQEYLLKALERRYAVLGLPEAQRTVLRGLLQSQQGPEHQDTMVKLVRLDLDAKDLSAALHDLPAENPADVSVLPGGQPEALEVSMLRAEVAREQHDLPRAARYLIGRTETQALKMRAQLMEQAKDWVGAVSALKPVIDAAWTGRKEASALSPDLEALVLELAGDASRAHDDTTLAFLKRQYGSLMERSASAGVFKLLVGESSAKPPAGG
ncbi:hypothetical protein JK192_03130 [Gluconobacter cerinus]|uniref:hypothetical protein n=1 Tax=Gluconobacter cerinus TaxID=38307 RepID=UPI001B8D3757|nr:hypothetical protein [Gluconobacter cerinus]MBS1030383.1 hypothetical protein [Gluconobacter cerinus]